MRGLDHVRDAIASSPERSELITIIEIATNDDLTYRQECAIADAILAAGYRRPNVVVPINAPDRPRPHWDPAGTWGIRHRLDGYVLATATEADARLAHGRVGLPFDLVRFETGTWTFVESL